MNITPQAKARELFNKFSENSSNLEARDSSLFCINQIKDSSIDKRFWSDVTHEIGFIYHSLKY